MIDTAMTFLDLYLGLQGIDSKDKLNTVQACGDAADSGILREQRSLLSYQSGRL